MMDVNHFKQFKHGVKHFFSEPTAFEKKLLYMLESMNQKITALDKKVDKIMDKLNDNRSLSHNEGS